MQIKLKAVVLGLSALALTACSSEFAAMKEEAAEEQRLSVLEKDPVPAADPELQNFEKPTLTDSEAKDVLSKYDFVDPTNTVPSDLLKDALIYYDKNLSHIHNTAYLGVVDFSRFNGVKRFYIINMRSGEVWSTYVAHGKGSDPSFTGYAQTFSNKSGSNKSSLGFYLTAEIYSGRHGRSLRLDGLSTTNSNVRDRAIVLHSAPYVKDSPRLQGRSDGCLAVADVVRDRIIDQLHDGAIIYAGLADHSAPSRTPAAKPPGGETATQPALWETKNHPERAAWTQYSYSTIQSLAPSLIAGSSDVTKFCPKYSELTDKNKITFWVYLVSGVAKFESNFDPTDRMLETSMGIDPVTHKRVYSEGLLQLSYQDQLAYPFCDEFDWTDDRKLAARSPQKSILDPFKNLKCGIQILNHQIETTDLIATTHNVYWSTLNPAGKYSKVSQIKNLTKQLPFCK